MFLPVPPNREDDQPEIRLPKQTSGAPSSVAIIITIAMQACVVSVLSFVPFAVHQRPGQFVLDVDSLLPLACVYLLLFIIGSVLCAVSRRPGIFFVQIAVAGIIWLASIVWYAILAWVGPLDQIF